MVRRFCLIATVGILVASSLPHPTAVPAAIPPSLAGTWRVERTCRVGCVGFSWSIEVVRPHGTNVYLASGPLSFTLYQIGSQVLVHGAASSSLLTIREPGQLMSGSGVATNGSTFSTTWRCIGPPRPQTSMRGPIMSRVAPSAAMAAPQARAAC